MPFSEALKSVPSMKSGPVAHPPFLSANTMSSDLVSSANLALVASGLLLLYISKKYLGGQTHPPYPPGPPGLPVLGSPSIVS